MREAAVREAATVVTSKRYLGRKHLAPFGQASRGWITKGRKKSTHKANSLPSVVLVFTVWSHATVSQHRKANGHHPPTAL